MLATNTLKHSGITGNRHRITLSDRRWHPVGGHFNKSGLLYLLLAFSCRIIYFEISEKPFENVDLHQGEMLDRSYVITK